MLATKEDYVRYAQLLVRYCLSLQPGERLFVQSTVLAAPLVAEVYTAALELGAICYYQLDVAGAGEWLLQQGSVEQLAEVSPLYRAATTEYEAYLHIQAPYTLAGRLPDSSRQALRQAALQPWQNPTPSVLRRCNSNAAFVSFHAQRWPKRPE